MPHLPLNASVALAPCGAAVGGTGNPPGSGSGAAADDGAWQALLRASGRVPH